MIPHLFSASFAGTFFTLIAFGGIADKMSPKTILLREFKGQVVRKQKPTPRAGSNSAISHISVPEGERHHYTRRYNTFLFCALDIQGGA